MGVTVLQHALLRHTHTSRLKQQPTQAVARRRCAHMSDHRSALSHKLVLVGDTAVGKTCIASRFVRDEFNDVVASTIGGA